MRFDLTDLRLFVFVLRRGSITGGAAAMNLALASASQRIAGMEASLGTPLLVRAARGVRPTPAGTALLRHAEDLLLRSERMLGELRGYAAGARARIALPANTGALLGFLPEVLRRFLAAHPGLDVAVAEHPSPEIVRIVTEGGAELGIIADVVDSGALHVQRLREDRLVAVTAATHRLAGRGEVGFAELVHEPFVGLLDAALETHLAEHAARRNVTIRHRIRLRSVAAIGRMVRDGIGVAVLPETALEELDAAALSIAPLSDAWARRGLALCLRSAAGLTPPARLLAAAIREAVAP
ncbi:MAG: LysR family transcriptional regulator, partial [Rhodospirillales bacterium]|nr:LysR family transcriptional regulator [Rhodospirillales bacterium]